MKAVEPWQTIKRSISFFKFFKIQKFQEKSTFSDFRNLVIFGFKKLKFSRFFEKNQKCLQKMSPSGLNNKFSTLVTHRK